MASGLTLDSITSVHELTGEEDMKVTYTSSFLDGTGMEKESGYGREAKLQAKGAGGVPRMGPGFEGYLPSDPTAYGSSQT